MEERNTLLIVDDFEFNRLMLSDTFSDRTVVEAENGKRAIEEFEKNKDKLCAVLLDIMMPVMDGFGVLEYLVDNKYIDDIPVFIISADTSDKSLSRAYDLGRHCETFQYTVRPQTYQQHHRALRSTQVSQYAGKGKRHRGSVYEGRFG